MHGARVVDAHAFAVDAAASRGPMLIAQCDSRLVCSEVKLALLESLPPEHEVTVLQRLGLPDERVFTVALADVDRDVEPDHLTSLFVDTGDAAVGPELARLLALTERLRGPGGCPWDAEQTHHSLRRHVLEEAYEVVEAIEQLPADAPRGDIPLGAYDALEDELGDLLFQVMIQSVLASEAGAFTVADVARGVHTKLVRRHPHVFGDVQVDRRERGRDQLGADQEGREGRRVARRGHHARACPPLIAAQKLFRKGASVGLGARTSISTAALRALARCRRRRLRGRARHRCSRPRSRSGACTTSTPSRRSRAGPAATRIGSGGWSSSPPTQASTSRAAGAAQVRDLWDRAGA